MEIAIIAFGGGVSVVHEFSAADTMNLAPLQAGGPTPLGQAMDAALAEIEHRKTEYRANASIITGPGSGSSPTACRPMTGSRPPSGHGRRRADKKATIFCVGIGNDANIDILSQFSTRPAVRLEGLQFREMFKWLSSSLARVSQAKAGAGEQVALAPVQGWGSVLA